MSRTVVFDAYGGPEVLHLLDVPVPDPGPDEVVVRVRTAGVQPVDAMFRRGRMHQFAPASFPQRLGNEFAGVVEAVGSAVTGVTVGDGVLGWVASCAYADHVVTRPDEFVRKPEAMSWAEAGVLSASGQTAATVLTDLAVGAGDTLLVHAAAGGVGSYAVQLARARGATVIGTASPANHDYLRGLGAFPVAYGDGLVERLRALAPHGVDAALVAVSTVDALTASLELVADKQRIGTVAYLPEAAELGVRRLGSRRSTGQLRELTAAYERGELRIPVAEEIPLAEAERAHRAIETGHVRGKLVLTTA
jgi:enoyl reductase